MPRDFNSFVNDKRINSQTNEEKVNEYKNIIDKYKDLTSSELMSSLMSEAAKLKQEGKLDSSMLDNLKSTLTPFLTNEQKTTLDSLITTINNQK